jgi:hypothetical protein
MGRLDSHPSTVLLDTPHFSATASRPPGCVEIQVFRICLSIMAKVTTHFAMCESFLLTASQFANINSIMLNMIPVTIDLGALPEEERRTLCEEALRRGVPFEHLVREALLKKAREVVTNEHQNPA